MLNQHLMKSKFNLTSFISIGLLFSFLLMAFSGVVLFIAPEGSISRWIGWSVLGLSKKQWEHQHTIFSYLFIAFAIFHIFKINWQLLLSYLKSEKFSLSNSKEIFLVLVITIIVFSGTLNNIQPFKWIIDSGSNISERIGESAEIPSISNPEKLNLEQFANEVLIISYENLVNFLESEGFNSISKEITIEDFCNQNNIIPAELYKKLKN
jgi:hypothetical protein